MESNDWKKIRRSEWFEGKSCVCQGCKWHIGVCGSIDKLELDHIDPTTKDPLLKTNRNAIWSWDLQRRSEELSKCQVLCKKCHAQKTSLGKETAKFGSSNPRAKMTEKNILTIRELVENGAKQIDVAKAFNTSRQQISRIVLKQRWNHI